MSVDGGVPGCACEVLSLSVRDMFAISLDVPLGKSEIENEDFMAGLIQTDTEIVWLDISVDKVAVMDVLNSLNHLINEDENAFQ